MASLIMGAWFYMTAVGNFVAGKIGEATGGHGGEMTKELTLAIYNMIGWIAIGVGVVVLALSPFVKRWMHLDTLRGRATLAGRPRARRAAGAGHATRAGDRPRARRSDARGGHCAGLRGGHRRRGLRRARAQAEAKRRRDPDQRGPVPVDLRSAIPARRR